MADAVLALGTKVPVEAAESSRPGQNLRHVPGRVALAHAGLPNSLAGGPRIRYRLGGGRP
jgi:hypothetical protein